MPAERDELLKKLFSERKTRQEAMKAAGITNTNSMSSASSRLGLHWRLNAPARQERVRTPRIARPKAVSLKKLQHEQLKQRQTEPAPPKGPKVAPDRTDYRRYGTSTHLSAKQRRVRGLMHLDRDLVLRGGAFEGIPSDIAIAFARFYENPHTAAIAAE